MTPVALDYIVKTCLAKDPDDRWQSAGDVARQVRGIIDSASPSVAVPVSAAPQSAGWRRAAVASLATLIVGGAAIGLAVWSATRPTDPPTKSVRRFALDIGPARPIQGGNTHAMLAWSPDGTRLVYAAAINQRGVSQLYVRDLDDLEARPLDGTELAYEPFFSPDGEWVGFSGVSSPFELKRVDVGGGTPLTLCECSQANGATWLPDGSIILSDRATVGALSTLHRIPEAGGTPEPLTTPDAAREELGQTWPHALPGGTDLLFTTRTRDTDINTASVAVLSLDTGEQHVVVEGGFNARYLPTGHLVFGRDGALWGVPFDLDRLVTTGPEEVVLQGIEVNEGGSMALSVSANGTLVYWPGDAVDTRFLTPAGGGAPVWVDRNGQATPIGGDRRDVRHPRLSPDNTRLAMTVVSTDGRQDIWVDDLERGTSTRLTDDGTSIFPAWSLDGTRVFFGSNKYGLCLADELLARRSLEGLGNGWAGAPEQRGKEFGEVDEPLSCGADDAGEDLLGLRAAGRPITAADFAVDDGGANGVLGTPVGGLHLGRPQEGEHGGELAVEMGGEALGGRQGGRRVEESPEAREQAPAGHGEAVLGDRVRLPSITEREGVGEDRLHASRPRTARMIRGEGMRSAHQVRQTRLMQRRGEAAIRRPPVSHQDAVKVGAQHLGRLVEATPVANAIHRGLRRRKRPQPVPHRADPPAGLVGAHDGTAADLCAQRGVGRGGHAGRAMQHLHEPPGRHRQPEALPQECGHLGEGHADLLVQARNQGDGARPQVDVGGPHRVRGLQRMAALHAAPALGALPDGHIKAPDNRPDDGEIFLVLRRHALQCHRPAAPRTRRRERGLVGRINPGGNRATRPASIPTAGPPPRPPAPALGPIFGERCGLTEPRAPRGTE